MSGFDLQTFNRFQSQNKSTIAKALTTATGVGAALIPQSLQKLITNTVIYLSPEIQMISPRQVTSKTPEFNQLSSLPAPVGAMGESSVTPSTNSNFSRNSVTLKVIRRKGQVTNFIVDTARELVDAYALETENQIRAHVLDLNGSMLYGNSVANTYDFDGWEKLIATNRVNKGRAGVVPTSLKELDDLIDATNRKGAGNLKRFFSMSPELLSSFTRLETTIRKSVAVSGTGGQWGEIYLPGGQRLESYRGIPIIQSTWTKPIEQMRPTITLGSTSTGGTLSNGTYYIQISPVTRQGEQQASAEQSITLSGGTSTQAITMTLSDTHRDASGYANTYYYKIYTSSTTLTETLVKVVPAFVYDGTGALNGYNGISGAPFVWAGGVDSSVTTAMSADVPLVANSGVVPEVVGLICVDPIQGLGDMPYANVQGDMFSGLVTAQALAQVDDYRQFLIKSYTAITPSFEATSAWARGYRVA